MSGLAAITVAGATLQNLFESMKTFALMWGMYSGADQTSAAKEAFKAATIGSAKAIGLGDEIGLLRPGYRADLVLIDTSQPNYRPLNSALRQLVYGETGRSIAMVMVEGKIVVESGKLASPKYHDLKEKAEHARRELSPHIKDMKARNDEILTDVLAAYDEANSFPLGSDRFSLRRH